MSNLIIVDRDKITAIADVIREKTESDLFYTIDEMPKVIQNIVSGGSSDIFLPDLVIGESGTDANIFLEIQIV